MNFGLKETYIKKINNVFTSFPEVEEVILYGSRAKGNYRKGADIDLTMIGKKIDFKLFNKISGQLDDLLLPYQIDLSLFRSIENQDLIEHINRVGKSFYKKNVLEWKEYRLGDIAEIVGGGTPSTKIKEFWNGEIAWLTPRDLSNHICRYIERGERNITKFGLASSSSKILPKNSVLLSSRAPVGYLAIAKNEITTNQGFRSFVTNNKVHYEFLYYLLKENVEYLKSQATGSTFGEISGSTLKSLVFSFPPLSEQKTIAEVLSTLDDKIDLLYRQNKTLEAMAETLFSQWFPLSKELRRAGIKEADESWEEGKLPDEFNFIMGASPPGESYNEDGLGIPMYQGNADFEFRFPKRRVFTTEPKRFAEKFDTLISVRAPVGEQNMANERCCIGRGVAAFRYKNDNSFYTYTYFKMKSIMEEIKQFNETGTVFGSISKGDFENLEIIIPEKRLVERFQSKTKPIDDKIILNCFQISTLEKLRDTLLPKLMSGEVRVKQ